MAPILSLLRSLAGARHRAPAVYYYGARTEADLFHLEELEALAASCRPSASSRRCRRRDGWDGETGLITDVVERLEDDLAEVDAYVCGPPPMVEAAIALLIAKGVPESRIYFDKFTTTADGGERAPWPPRPASRNAASPSPSSPTPRPAPRSSRPRQSRSFNYFTPRKRRATVYEDVTVDVQPDPERHLTQGWIYALRRRHRAATRRSGRR